MKMPMQKAKEMANKSMLERVCVVTKYRAPQTQLLRFVVDADGVVFPDINNRAGGRGAWLKADAAVLKDSGDALKKTLKARGVVEDLPVLVERLLVGRVQEILALGRRAGAVIGGAGKIRTTAENVVLLLVAHDASPREAKTLANACGLSGIDILRGEELGKVFGRESMAFVACLGGHAGLIARLHDELARLHGVCQGVRHGVRHGVCQGVR